MTLHCHQKDWHGLGSKAPAEEGTLPGALETLDVEPVSVAWLLISPLSNPLGGPSNTFCPN